MFYYPDKVFTVFLPQVLLTLNHQINGVLLQLYIKTQNF